MHPYLIAAAHHSSFNLSNMLHNKVVLVVALCVLAFCLPSMLGLGKAK